MHTYMGKLKWVTKSVSFSCQYPPNFPKSVSFPSAFDQLFALPVFAYPFRGRRVSYRFRSTYAHASGSPSARLCLS